MKLNTNFTHAGRIHRKTEQMAVSEQGLRHSLSGKHITTLLILVTLVLLALHLLTLWIVYHDNTDSGFVRYLDLYFNFNYEDNFPSYFSAFLLLFSSLLLWFIHRLTEGSDRYRAHWLLLAMVFLFLSLDEAVQIHERVELLTDRIFTNRMEGYLSWTWIIPYMLLFIAVTLYSVGFVRQLPRPVRNKFMLAGALFVFAAAGIESIEGRLMVMTAKNPLVLMVTTTAQELLEMASIILFISGLLKYLTLKVKSLNLHFT